MKVVISNGYGQFHMLTAMPHMYQEGVLAKLITGGYPNERLGRAMSQSLAPALQRLAARRVNVPDEYVSAIWLGEILFQVSQAALRMPAPAGWVQPRVAAKSFDAYARLAVSRLQGWQETPDIYHFRAGFGGRSVQHARELGLKIVCDHSIAHPRILPDLVRGKSFSQCVPVRREELDPVWRRVDADLDAADATIVNSEFVRRTCGKAGMNEDRIHVNNQGLDAAFRGHLPKEVSRASSRKTDLVFAGTCERRKGIAVLAQALESLEVDCSIEIVGGWKRDSLKAKQSISADSRVRLIDRVSRGELARRLANARIFVFPTFAEGSARVVMEAMAAGCAVITTGHAGSLVEDGASGRLVRAGDSGSLARQIAGLLRDDHEADALGRAAREQALSCSDAEYGARMSAIYMKILNMLDLAKEGRPV